MGLQKEFAIKTISKQEKKDLKTLAEDFGLLHRQDVQNFIETCKSFSEGRALKYYASLRLDIRRIESLKQSGEVMGNRTSVKVVKNKIAAPFKETEFDIMFGQGISVEGDILDQAVEKGVITKCNAWYLYNDNKIG